MRKVVGERTAIAADIGPEKSKNCYWSGAIAFLYLLAGIARGATYYVDGGNGAANDTNPGTLASPWKTISKANQILVAGDTVYIRGGGYTSYIFPVHSGTASQPITYANYGSESVTVSNAVMGVQLNGNSYIVVKGLHFYYLDNFIWLVGASHNTLANCTFDQGRNIGWSGSKIYKSSQYNWVHDCQFSRYGLFVSSSQGTVLDVGNEEDSTDISNYNLIENCTMFYGGHHVLGVFGMYNIIRNSYFHNDNWSNGHGERVIYVNGYPANSGRNLFEGNRICYSGIPYPPNYGAAGMSLDTRYNIVRSNYFYHNNLAGISMSTTANYYNSPSYNRVYNNTFLHNGFTTSSSAGVESKCGIGFARYSAPATNYPIVQNAIKNNLFRYNPVAYGYYADYANERTLMQTDQIYAGNWEETGDPLFVNAPSTLGDPMNPGFPDMTLRTNSPCIDAGAFLTTITSATGAGTTLQLQDASYFIDGWGMVQGDLIQLQGSQQKARITSVNYTANTITVSTNLSWSRNQAVALAYNGASPDIGAYESGLSSGGGRPPAPANLRVISSSP